MKVIVGRKLKTPQNSSGKKQQWDEEHLNDFGNLALLTVKGNSKFSNLLPKSKIDTYEDVVKQSPKLMQMAKIARQKGEGTKEEAKTYGERMLERLDKEIEKCF